MGAVAAVHGDDCTITTTRKDAERILSLFKKKYEVKHQMIGQASDLGKEAQILNRRITWGRTGLWYEADPRHQMEVLKALGMEECSPVKTPEAADKSSGCKGDEEEGELDREGATRYRAVVARLNYLAQDRPDIRNVTAKLCCHMSCPKVADLTKLKRVARYLRYRPRAGQLMKWQRADAKIRVYTDSDWAGDQSNRKSYTGVAIFYGGHLIKTMSKQQAVVSLSSMEAELYALCKGTTEGLGIQSYFKDLGRQREVETYVDSSAALSLTSKRGLGKAKHISVQHLWVQGAARDKRTTFCKVLGRDNPADLMTKGLDQERIVYLMDLCGFSFGGE